MRMTFDEIKAALKGKPKKEQIQFVTKELKDYQQGLANERLKGNPPMTGIVGTYKTPEPEPEPTEEQKKARAELLQKQAKERKEREERQKKQEQKEQDLINKEVKKYTDLIAEIEARDEAHARKMRRNELKPFMCDRPLDWYFNKENILNQKLLFELFDEIEKYSFDNLTTDDFINILFYYREFINDNAAEPFKPISRIKAAPLNEDESQLLYKLILKSFGNLKSEMKAYSALMLIERMVNETNGNAEIGCTVLSPHFIIPMDETFTSQQKALAHYIAHNKLSKANVELIISKNSYHTTKGEKLKAIGFSTDYSRTVKTLKSYLNQDEIYKQETSYKNLVEDLDKIRVHFISLNRNSDAGKANDVLQKLTSIPQKRVK